MIVAIDGEAGAGKTTVAACVAEALGCSILESGSLYRALAWKALKEGLDTSNEEEITSMADRTSLNIGPNSSVLVDGNDVTAELSGPDVGKAASVVAGFGGVRRWLLPMQRRMAEHEDLVAEGRDMGSVVFPDADFKFFLEASLDVRAKRRQDQMETRGKKIPLERIIEQMGERDERDYGRKLSPLEIASDALVIDTTETNTDTVVDMILKRVNADRESQLAC